MKNINILLLLWAVNTLGQPNHYSLANAHSHNDYEQQSPFFLAYQLAYGSIEADVFLKDNELYVAHNQKDIRENNTFKKLYLTPVLTQLTKPHARPVQLLIDLKTEGISTLKLLSEQILPYKRVLKKNKITIVISGNMPVPSDFKQFDKIFTFDGRKEITYSKAQSKRILLLSCNRFALIKSPNSIKNLVDSVHLAGKKIRFWGFDNSLKAYETQKQLGVDFIGTDSLFLLKSAIGF